MGDVVLDTKIIAMYLPQYHVIEENSKFWGEGFTDWIAVKNAKKIFPDHNQPRKPLNDNYYDLSKVDALRAQADTAKQYGIDGFCFYHYWFSSKKNIMTKPSENLLKNKDINISFCFAWDNANWRRSWSSIKGNDWAPMYEQQKDLKKKNGQEVLIPFVLGDKKEWKKHFDYLVPFFIDDRYLKSDGKPIFIIWNYSIEYEEMEKYWDSLAVNAGLKGVKFIYKFSCRVNIPKHNKRFFYEPALSSWELFSERFKRKIRRTMHAYKLSRYDYDKTWHRLIKRANSNDDDNIYFGGFVGYDDTPRRGKRGQMIVNQNKDTFKLSMEKLLNISNKKNKEFLFITAWNEWGEGAYLEPDETNGYTYLEALKAALDESRTE